MECSHNLISGRAADAPEKDATASTVNEKSKSEEGISMTATPTYRPPGYPEMGTLWTQPPQALPGPDDHPFFKWIADGAKKDPAILATMSPRPACIQPALPIRLASSLPMAVQPRAVYPFVPPPSVTMEPITPDVKSR